MALQYTTQSLPEGRTFTGWSHVACRRPLLKLHAPVFVTREICRLESRNSFGGALKESKKASEHLLGGPSKSAKPPIRGPCFFSRGHGPCHPLGAIRPGTVSDDRALGGGDGAVEPVESGRSRPPREVPRVAQQHGGVPVLPDPTKWRNSFPSGFPLKPTNATDYLRSPIALQF